MANWFKAGLGRKEFSVALWLTAIALGIVFAVFYHCQFSEWESGWIAKDYKDHLDTALTFVDYCGAYKTRALEVFKAENRFSYVVAYPAWHVSVLLASKVLGAFKSVLGEQEVLVCSVVLVNTALLVAAYLVIVGYFRKLTNGPGSIIAAICAMFCGPLDNFGMFVSYYLGAYTGNIWHNPTYLAVKPVALACFFAFSDILGNESARTRDYVKASLLLGLSAFCKPSFYQCFVPALVVYCVLHWLIRRNRATFFHFLKVAAACIPIAAIAALQSGFALSGEGGAGLSVEPLYVILHFTQKWRTCILLSVAFPLLVFLFCAVAKKWNGKVELAFWTLVSAFAMYLVFYVDANPFAGDFSWAVGLALNIGFVVAAGELLKWWQGGTPDRILALVGSALFAVHAFFGFVYFAYVWESGEFFAKYGSAGSLVQVWKDCRGHPAGHGTTAP